MKDLVNQKGQKLDKNPSSGGYIHKELFLLAMIPPTS